MCSLGALASTLLRTYRYRDVFPVFREISLFYDLASSIFLRLTITVIRFYELECISRREIKITLPARCLLISSSLFSNQRIIHLRKNIKSWQPK